MGLDLLPYLQDHAILVVHNNKVFKLKITYKDALESQDKAYFKRGVSRQEVQDQLEEVLRAVLYILERVRQILPIQTNNLVVHPKTVPWVLANKIEFMIDDRALHCYPDCLIFEVHCKPLEPSRRSRDGVTTKSRQDVKVLQPHKQTDRPNTHTTEAGTSSNRNIQVERKKSRKLETPKSSLLSIAMRSRSKNAENHISSIPVPSIKSTKTHDKSQGNVMETRHEGETSEKTLEKNKSPSSYQLRSHTNLAAMTKNALIRSWTSNVLETAKNCIKRYRHGRTASLKQKEQSIDKALDSNDNSCYETRHGTDFHLYNGSLKQQQATTGFEMRDSDMVEIYHNGSLIISPSKIITVQRSRRKRPSNSPDCEARSERNIAEKIDDIHEAHNVASPNKRKRLYNANDSFSTSQIVSNSNTTLSNKPTRLSPRASYYKNKKFGSEINNRQRQHKSSSTSDSSSETSSSETRNSPYGRHRRGQDIVEQYQKLLENSRSTQTKCVPHRDSVGLENADDRTISMSSNMDHSDNLSKPYCNLRNTPNTPKPKFQELSGSVPFNAGAVLKRRAKQRSPSSIDKQPLLCLDKQRNYIVASADGQGNDNIANISKNPLSPRLTRSKRDLSDPLFVQSSQRRKRFNIANKARSDSKLKEFRLTCSRLLSAKDGVWLFPTNLSSHGDSNQKKQTRRRAQVSLKAHEEDFSPTSSQRTQKSASSPCLTSPEVSPESSNQYHQKEEDKDKRPSQPFKFFQVLTYFMSGSSAKK